MFQQIVSLKFGFLEVVQVPKGFKKPREVRRLHLLYFPNRSLLLRVLMGNQRGSPRKHTQSVQRPERWPGPGSQEPFEKSSGFTIKVKIQVVIYVMRNFFHGFCRADGFCMRFPTVWKCCPKKMFLHLIFARVFSFKHFGWLQKTFLLIDLRQWIESINRINESNRWIESMHRINESNQ